MFRTRTLDIRFYALLFACAMAAAPVIAAARRVNRSATPRYAISNVSATPTTLAPGQTVVIKADFQLGQTRTVATYFEIRNASNTILSSQSYNSQAFSAGHTRSYDWSFTVPSTWAAGTYFVQAGIFKPDWSTALDWASNATSFAVADPSTPPSTPPSTSSSAITNGTATPSSLAPGQTVAIRANFELGEPGTVGTYFEIRNASNTIVSSQSYAAQIFAAGQVRQYTWNFTVPGTFVAGTYRVQAGIFPPDWSSALKWVSDISSFTVAAGAPPSSGGSGSTGGSGRQFYVDSVSGSDSNSGTSTSAPWQSLSKVSGTPFQPGDVVNFKRGSSWTGTLQITSSGTSSDPITYQAYGTGAAPRISNPGVSYGDDIDVSGDWNVVRDFLLTQAYQAGIRLVSGGDHNVVRNLEITASGLGVQAQGQYELITQNYVHDLTLVNNSSSTDYGAVCFWIENSNNEVSFNKGVNCRAQSNAYGHDGGFVEVWNNGDNLYVHNNDAEGTNGFMEVGSGGSGSVANVKVAYNVIHNVKGSPGICLNGGTNNIAVSNFHFENNTWVATSGDSSTSRVFGCRSDLTALTVRNNIFYSDVQIADNGNFTHSNNLYYMTNMVNGSGIGYSFGAGERSANPLFVDLSGGNFALQAGSPAIDAGLNLGYGSDFAGNPVPQGSAPDLGAYEFQP
ncbi:MAG TPA: choice-of-anchor Q domain-containing protein [Vicinamibacterales bacterium]